MLHMTNLNIAYFQHTNASWAYIAGPPTHPTLVFTRAYLNTKYYNPKLTNFWSHPSKTTRETEKKYHKAS